MFDPTKLALAALLVPAVAAVLIAAIPPLRRDKGAASTLSIAAVLASLAASVALLVGYVVSPEATVEVTRWLPGAGATVAEAGLQLDGVSLSMLVVVTLVASSVQIFSLGYMADEEPPAFGRYFGYHSLFVFAMNLLVLAPNLLQAFVGWELVGVASYLLIGFYFRKPSAARAALKAFWMTKLADMGLLIGLLVLYRETGSFSWEAALPVGVATTVTLLVFVAVMGKSAQFPLHVWLPDAMEGPTPVSALLHAATMVAAGVFLVVRADPLFDQAPLTGDVMAWVGGFTALFAAAVAVVQTDIKRVLAYSTVSQLGYMVCALGAGSLMGGFFHLTTHAFFKALLFLAAGSVIHGVGSNELRDMGGLWSRMKLTCVVFVIGALALAGFPLLSGFFSKDLILEAVFAEELWGPGVFLMIAAFLTAFYMGRVVLLAFFGEPSERARHAHEGGPSMRLPLVVLAAGSVSVGWFGSDLAAVYDSEYHFHVGPIGLAATALALAGVGVAWLRYGRRREGPESFGAFEPLAGFARSGLVDRAYAGAYRHALLAFAAVVGWLDRYVVDGVMNLTGWVTIVAGRGIRRTQTGNVQHYVYVVVAATLVLVAWGLFR